MSQIMGALPKERITISRLFNIFGIDFGGLFMVKPTKLRTTKTYKDIFMNVNMVISGFV